MSVFVSSPWGIDRGGAARASAQTFGNLHGVWLFVSLFWPLGHLAALDIDVIYIPFVMFIECWLWLHILSFGCSVGYLLGRCFLTTRRRLCLDGRFWCWSICMVLPSVSILSRASCIRMLYLGLYWLLCEGVPLLALGLGPYSHYICVVIRLYS